MATFKDDVTHEQFLRETGPVADRVRFLPFMDQTKLAAQLARSTVFAMPSFYESCGNGWLEAAACGVPVVGSALSCGPEVICDGETGFLPNPHNPREVADKVILLLNNPCLAHDMGQAGRARALRLFSVPVAVKKSERFYEECRRIP
jgi:glycosyltransferase involved in cell wall biosynthesis